MSANGNTVLLGDGSVDNPTNDDGTATVFDRSGSTWNQTATLSNAGNVNCGNGACDHFGGSLALSAYGTTAIAGDTGDNSGDGSAWSFDLGTPPQLVVNSTG